MGAGHSAEGEGGAYASDPPAQDRRKGNQKRRRHSVDSVASYSSQNHVDRIRTQNFSTASCQDDGDFGSIKTSLFRRSSSNLEYPQKRPESVTSNASSTRSRLRELVERKSNQDLCAAVAAVGDIQYFENPSESLEFDRPRNDSKKSTEERPKKRKLAKKEKEKEKEKEREEKNKKQEKYQSKLAEYYKLPVQLPQDEFYQHLTRSKAADDLLQKRFANADTEFNGSYGRLCKHKEPEGSNLRRSRSLAVIREETFTDLQIQNHNKKRSQLIPRARLFDKPCFKDRLPGRAKYQTKEEVLESIYIDSTASCFGDINAHRESDNRTECTEAKSDKEDAVSRIESTHSRSVSGSWPNLNEDIKHISEDSIGHSRNPSEIDSLDSNYVRKHYNFDAHLKGNYKGSSPESDRSVISPNDSKQLYITTDDLDTESEVRDRSKNNTPKSFTNDSLSITHSEKEKHQKDENANENDYYDEVSLKSERLEREDILSSANVKATAVTHNEGDQQSLVSENDETVSSPESITSYISISIASSTDNKSHKLEYLANSLAEKIDEYCEAQYPETTSVASHPTHLEQNQEPDPIYTKVNKKRTFAEIRRDSFASKSKNIFNVVPKKTSSEVYISNTYIEGDDYSARSSQRHCASTKNITTEPFVTTLIENQYYSLPDINISKCLRKSERIDAQLREEDPEDIPDENTYEIAYSNFRENSSQPCGNYGQLNQTHVNNNQISIQTSNIYFPEYSEPQIIQNFSKLEDDLKSIITIESSNDGNEKDLNYYRTDTHQNEREINEIENTIRNTKVITKSESLKIANSVYRPQFNLSKSRSNDQINTVQQENKARVGIKKHYSLRQRDPGDDIDRLPSPDTVAKTLCTTKGLPTNKVPNIDDNKANSLISRVQTFKTSAESNISIVPLSGHQTIVIDPPVTQNSEIKEQRNPKIIDPPKSEHPPKQQAIVKPCTEIKFHRLQTEDKKEARDVKNSTSSVDTSSYCTPKDPFITIKLNKVVKTNLPKLKKETSEKIAYVQHKFEKPPARLIIKDSGTKNCIETQVIKVNSNMTRPQILQVVDSKSRKLSLGATVGASEEAPIETKATINLKSDATQRKEEIIEIRNEPSVKEKLNNAIKTDIEYQEKLHSVKNYWSKLIEPNQQPDVNESTTKDVKLKSESLINIKDDEIKEQAEKLEEDNNSVAEISVGSMIKSIENVKIVDSIKKICQSKVHLWKDDTEKVKSDSEIEETTVKKIIKDCEGTIYDNNKQAEKSRKDLEAWTRNTPEIEIVELSCEDNQNQKTQATLIKAKGFEKGNDEFDHVRYKVMKSELFKNSMIANYRKEAQFDGLLQYLQDYSFQELLVNNNIVIIEPVRTKVEPAPRKAANPDPHKIQPNLLKKTDSAGTQSERVKMAVRRHFFYHPIRVNKEIIEEELPNPDTVKKVRNLFEDTLKMKSPMTHDPPLAEETLGLNRRAASYRNLNEDVKNKYGIRKKIIRQLTIDTNYGNKKWDNASLSSGVSSGDLSSNNEYDNEGLSSYSHKNLKDNVYSSSDEYLCDSINHDFCCESQYVSPDIMKKIRDCGTSVTYYGGKVLSKPGSTVSPMTKAIMDEIKGLQKNCSRDCYSCQTKCRGEKCSCLSSDKHKKGIPERQHNSSTSSDSGNHDQDSSKRAEVFPGFKFKLVKSNSCSSRLELTGTDDNKSPRLKFRKTLGRTEDPPLIYDDENSVKNKICRLESYNKGIVNTPFETKEKVEANIALPCKTSEVKPQEVLKKTVIVAPQPSLPPVATKKEEPKNNNVAMITEAMNNVLNAATDAQSFEKKFYYVNENLEQGKASTGKFGEMVFEEFEVLESCFDSLNSSKSITQ